MLTLRKSQDRGYADHGWLKSFHSFSFAGYHDPHYMGWGNLRVINEDRIAPGTGFGTHGHRDMEIISYVLSGELAHKDNMGNGRAIPPGDVQRMSAGNGVMHSEFNHAPNDTTHFFQIWIQPNVTGIPASYEQKTFEMPEKRGVLRLVASPDGAQGSVTLHADARLYAGLLDGAEQATLTLNQKDMLIDGKRVNLSPGMNITAEIKTGKRRIIEFLLSPVQRAGSESLRER